MAAKAFLVACASVLLVQTINAQCLRGPVPALWEPAPAPILYEPARTPGLYEPALAPIRYEPAPAPILYEPPRTPVLYEPALAPIRYEPALAPIRYEPALAPVLYEQAVAPISYAPGCSAVIYDNIIASNVASASGGGLGVTTSSLFAPTGLSVLSENEIAGILEAYGNLPVLAAVALEGVLPTAGSAGTVYSCGTDQVGIASDSLVAAGIDAVGYGPHYVGASAVNAAAAAFGSGVYAPGGFTTPCFETAPLRYY